jgi:PAS domain S-box-containing protein/putative nucleotidyltransferase with HDIG domain
METTKMREADSTTKPKIMAINTEIWRYILDAIEAPVFIHDTQFRVQLANRAYCREAGMTEAEVLGKPYWEVFPQGTGPLPGCKVASDTKSHDDSQDEVRVGEKFFLSRNHTVRDDQGKSSCFLHMLSDITAQRRSEAVLAESEERFRRATELARDAIIALDAENGTVTSWNHAAEAIFGYGKEEVLGRGICEFLVPPEFREAAKRGMARFAAAGDGPMIGKTLDLVALHKNGTEFFVELSLSATQINGKWHATGIARDITERKRAHASEERFRRLFESSKDGILILDAETGMLLDANPFITELLGYARADCIGKHFWDLGFLKNVETNKDKFLGLQQQEYMRYEDITLETAQGQMIHVEFISNVYLVDNARVIQCNIRDITRRKLAEDKNLRLGQMYRTIHRCNETLVRATDELELAREMCRVLTEEGGIRMAWVGYAEQGADKRILPVAAAGIEEGAIGSLNPTWADEGQGKGPVGEAIRTGKASVCPDIRSDAQCEHELEQAARRGYLTVAAIPLKFDQDGLGVLVVYGAQANEFPEDIISLLEELAGDLAFGISNLRSRVDRLGILEKLEHSLDHAVTAIAATVEMRDPYTAGHQRRVAKLATAIATEMKLSADQVQGLHMACVVHDIGKIHVPAEILSSPAKLTDAEFDILKTHPKVGWDILKGIDFPWPVAEMVYQHHEKLDGSGFPRGLKGDEILLEARILTVADVVEAMSSHRPYRPGFGIFPALQEISRNKGKLYDAAVVEACLRVFMEKNYEL